MKTLKERSLDLHKKSKGKIEVISKVSVRNSEDLSLAYSPGVAEPCKAIHKNPEDAYLYTSKQNMVAVVTDGTAVLGLGDIGPQAALPVMEGKAVLFKEFAGVDAFPICLDTTDTEEIIRTVEILAPSFGGINLEDIAAPKCVEIERRLKKKLNIPVFHDDQHGTAIVTLAALYNSLKLVGKKMEDLKVVLSGTGAAGSSIARMLSEAGVKTIYGYNSKGVVSEDKYESYQFVLKELIDENIITPVKQPENDSLEAIMEGTDVFIGVSIGDIVSESMVRSMNRDPIIFAMANPDPEISPDLAKKAGAAVIGTGRSDYPNQINNVLAFPGLFRGVLDARAPSITEAMKITASKAIASIISEDELSPEYVIPSPFDPRVAKAVGQAVADSIQESN
ncbi:MAG: NAD(P)-dependent malic enzyme [Bacillota bacterium]